MAMLLNARHVISHSYCHTEVVVFGGAGFDSSKLRPCKMCQTRHTSAEADRKLFSI